MFILKTGVLGLFRGVIIAIGLSGVLVVNYVVVVILFVFIVLLYPTETRLLVPMKTDPRSSDIYGVLFVFRFGVLLFWYLINNHAFAVMISLLNN